MQYDDLTTYIYNPNWAKEGALNVGWLGSTVPDTQKPDEPFLEELSIFCCNPVHLMRGFHVCEICGLNPMSDSDPFFQKTGKYLGNGEIWIDEACSSCFVSPTMIFHYIADHHYKPPQRYIEAVLKA